MSKHPHRWGRGMLLAGALALSTPAQKLPLLVDSSGYNPQIAAVGSAVYVVFDDRRTSSANHDIYFNRSLDGGASWLPTSIRLNIGTPVGSAQSIAPSVAAVGDAVYVVWLENRSSAANADVFFTRSLDRGATWLPAIVRLDVGNAPGASNSWVPRLAVAGQSVYVVWVDYRNGATYPNLYFNRSLDRGTTWLPADLRLDTGSTPGTGGASLCSIAAAGGSVFVVWSDYRNGTSNADIFANVSHDRGTTWLPSDVRLNLGQPPGTFLADYPALGVDGASVFVAWQESLWYGGNADIHCNRSLDGGATWLPASVRLDTGTAPMADDSRYPRVRVGNSTALVVWQQRSGSSSYDVFCNRTADGGANWLGSTVRLDTGSAPGAADSYYPSLATAGHAVYVVWHDTRSAAPATAGADVYYNRSLDDGASWLPTDVRLSVGAPPGSRGNYYPSVAAGGDSVFVAWERLAYYSPYAVWFDLACGYQPYGRGTGGANGIVPSLSGSGLASIGSTVSLDFGNGLGGAMGLVALGAGSSAKVAQPLLGGTLLVQPSGPAQTVFLTLGGAVGVPGAGSGSVRIGVPNRAILLGIDGYFQGLFLDAGASGGVSMSNGLEIWIG